MAAFKIWRQNCNLLLASELGTIPEYDEVVAVDKVEDVDNLLFFCLLSNEDMVYVGEFGDPAPFDIDVDACLFV